MQFLSEMISKLPQSSAVAHLLRSVWRSPADAEGAAALEDGALEGALRQGGEHLAGHCIALYCIVLC